MTRILGYAAAAVLLFGMSAAPVMAGGKANPCNPCAAKANPCNPCAMKKKANPCNPCAMKKQPNPCNPCSMKKRPNPCNPCSMKKNPCNPCAGKGDEGPTLTRPHAFDKFEQAVALGKKLWHDEKLGTSGLACASCHADYENLNLEKNQNFPHYVNMVGDVVTLDQMINFCMVNPMKGKQLEKNSKEMTALAAYFRAYRMRYLRDKRAGKLK